MIELFSFQEKAASTIAERYRSFITDPERPRRRGHGLMPFFQTLHALTGAGKTPILAASASIMRTALPVEPIVLWISKARVVVEQTLVNLSDGGKYAHFIPQFTTQALADAELGQIADPAVAWMLLSTVATFNDKEGEEGSRKVFSVRPDFGNTSLWDTLIARKTISGKKRPLIVVYDEGHNLTEQQAKILLELKPEAIIIASATPKLPPTIAELIAFLKQDGFDDEALTTPVSSHDVVDEELVKHEIDLCGFVADERVAIDSMLAEYESLAKAALKEKRKVRPKCIYVCRTNDPHDELRPFEARTAPPIRIWRQLVDRGVDPSTIAVYCSLNVSSISPLPKEFVLFRGGERDYDKFASGEYRHIIFNLGLQEGWDDPECYLAYIDKSMGSDVQVEQVVGRVLRQPGALYFNDPRLNACGFFVRVDEKSIFATVLKGVQARLARDLPDVQFRSSIGRKSATEYSSPRKDRELPSVGLTLDDSARAVADVLESISDYRGSVDALATGQVAKNKTIVGEDDQEEQVEWTSAGSGMPVTAHWILRRCIERLYPTALSVCDLSDQRFTCAVHLGSKAAKQLEAKASEIVDRFLEHAAIGQLPSGEPQMVEDFAYDPLNKLSYKNSLHTHYSGLNTPEQECADAIDGLGFDWVRNPQAGGFCIPLLQAGTRRRFFPDFIVWAKKTIWLVDPKGDHLIATEAGRKLLSIDGLPGVLPVKICLITEGHWDKTFNKIGSSGRTTWLLQNGQIKPIHYPDYEKLVTSTIR